jgi:hypothetical protein
MLYNFLAILKGCVSGEGLPIAGQQNYYGTMFAGFAAPVT